MLCLKECPVSLDRILITSAITQNIISFLCLLYLQFIQVLDKMKINSARIKYTKRNFFHVIPVICHRQTAWDGCSGFRGKKENFLSLLEQEVNTIFTAIMQQCFLRRLNHNVLMTIGHFRVLLCLCFKTSLSAKPFMWKWVLHAVSFLCKSKSFS